MTTSTHRFHHIFSRRRATVAVFALLMAVTGVFYASSAFAADPSASNSERLVTIHDGTSEVSLVTRGVTVGDALKQADISLSKQDIVEPAATAELVAKSYQINIYRARPVTIVDGTTRISVMTAEQSPRLIMQQAKLTLYDEDTTSFERVDNVLDSGGAGLRLVVKRATAFNLELYGKQFVARTQATTVGAMMKEKNIQLGKDDGISVDQSTLLSADMLVRIWRNGKQTVTVEEAIAKSIEEVRDADKLIGFREVRTPGTDGKKNVTYEIEMQNGIEVSRTVIASVTTSEPVKEVVVIGSKSNGGLTKSKGVNYYTDSKGVTHRETYYDLPMQGVMRNCGGSYTVRADGAKVDQDGYVLVAASLSRYPRCSIVETSLGLGKVYDTGAFTATHPDGFDLATDWTNYNGN